MDHCGGDGLDDSGVGHLSNGVDWLWPWNWKLDWLWNWHVNWEWLWYWVWAWDWHWAWDRVGSGHQTLAHYTNVDGLVKGKAGRGLSDDSEVAGESPGSSESSGQGTVTAESAETAKKTAVGAAEST